MDDSAKANQTRRHHSQRNPCCAVWRNEVTNDIPHPQSGTAFRLRTELKTAQSFHCGSDTKTNNVTVIDCGFFIIIGWFPRRCSDTKGYAH